MDRLRRKERTYLGYGAILASVGALALTGCGEDSRLVKKDFAECRLEQIQGQKPLNLSEAAVDPQDLPAIKQAVKIYPSVLIDTAERLDILGEIEDKDHDGNLGSSVKTDYVDNPGDILCEATPLGSVTSKKREVFYDREGKVILQKVEAALAELSTEG